MSTAGAFFPFQTGLAAIVFIAKDHRDPGDLHTAAIAKKRPFYLNHSLSFLFKAEG
jgi:hypothetical protein